MITAVPDSNNNVVVRKANNLWLVAWGLVAVALVALAFILPFWIWAICALGGFGPMEGIGIFGKNPRYPPLTDVIRSYVPRWACLMAMWALLAAAGSEWGVSWSHPLALAAWFGLAGWITNHFTVRYDQPLYN